MGASLGPTGPFASSTGLDCKRYAIDSALQSCIPESADHRDRATLPVGQAASTSSRRRLMPSKARLRPENIADWLMQNIIPAHIRALTDTVSINGSPINELNAAFQGNGLSCVQPASVTGVLKPGGLIASTEQSI